MSVSLLVVVAWFRLVDFGCVGWRFVWVFGVFVCLQFPGGFDFVWALHGASGWWFWVLGGFGCLGLLVVCCEFLCYGVCVCGAALGLGVAFAFGFVAFGWFYWCLLVGFECCEFLVC